MSKQLLIISVLLISLNVCLTYGQTDKTLEKKATGNDVVDAAIQKIKDSGIFRDDNGIMKRIAYVESKFGNDPNTFREGYNGGIWQIDAGDQGAFTEITKNAPSHQQLNTVILPAIKDKFGIDFRKIEYKELVKPLYSALAARMYLHIAEGLIPDESDIRGQAEYWKKNYNTVKGKGTVEKFIKDVEEMEKKFGKNCSGLMDLAIIMDGSSSINEDGNDNYKLAKEFVDKLIDTLSLDSVNVGFVVFSAVSNVIFPLDSKMSSAQMENAIMQSEYPGWNTMTNLGIESGVNILQRATKRPGVPKIMAVFTDGEPTCTDEQLNQALSDARANSITLFAIGIGNGINQDNLIMIAGSSNRVVSMSSYKSLSQSFKQINGETCKIPQTPVLGSGSTDVLGQIEKRYFKYELPSNGITLKINNHAGKTIGYYSYKNENPSSALNDGQFSGQTFIPLRQPSNGKFKREVSHNTVFIAIEGLEATNNYTLGSEQGNHVSGASTFSCNTFTIILVMIFYLVY